MSGYLYSKKENYIKRKFKSLMVPYFAFSIISFIYWFFIERFLREQETQPLEAFINIFLAKGDYVYNVVLWFLPCLFVTEIAFNFIFSKVKKTYCTFIIIIISILGYIYPYITNIRLPFGIDIAMTAIVFYYMGVIFRQKESQIVSKTKKFNVLIFLLGIIIILFYSFSNSAVNMASLGFGKNYFLFYLISIIGSYIMYLISNKIENKFVIWVGHNSLYFMCIHEPVKRIIIAIYSKIIGLNSELARQNIIHGLIMSILTIIVVSILVILLNKILSILKEKIENRKLKKVEN